MKTSNLFAIIVAVILAAAAADLSAQEKHPLLSRLSALVGDWAAEEAEGVVGDKPMATYRLTAAGSAVVETLFPGDAHEMVTIYTADGDEVILTHYCAIGNQPRMRAAAEQAAEALVFDFDGGTNFDSAKDMHMHNMKMTFLGADRIKHEWTLHSDGEAVEELTTFTLQRIGTPSAPEAEAPPAMLSGEKYAFFGAGVHQGETLSVAKVLADPSAHADSAIRIEGDIAEVCAKKGCWMRLADEESEVFVRFVDYAFFVPTDTAAGTRAIVEGSIFVETQSVEDQRHYLEDAGKTEEAKSITEPKQVVSFMATGVALAK